MAFSARDMDRDGLVNANLNPTEICQAISPKPDTTANPTTAAPAL